MEEEDNIIVKWAQEDVEMSYNLLNKNFLTTLPADLNAHPDAATQAESPPCPL